MLGRGGFGVVVAAINRMDGRQYAVKKIRLDAQAPLSRLQHPNIVRYFQVRLCSTEHDAEQFCSSDSPTQP